MRVFIYRTDEGQILLSIVGEEESINGVKVTLLGFTELTMTHVEENQLL